MRTTEHEFWEELTRSQHDKQLPDVAETLGLFMVAIFGPFSAHFQLHFWIIFSCLAEE
jgi:hypothetical protein